MLQTLLVIAVVAVDFFAGPKRMVPNGFGAVVRLAVLLWLCVGCVALLGRPLSGTSVALFIVAALSLASAIKQRLLLEPLVFTDLALVGAIMRHPRLYFLGGLRGIAFVTALGLSIFGALILIRMEPSIWGSWLIHFAALAAWVGVTLLVARGLLLGAGVRMLERRLPTPALESHLARYGLLTTLLLYTCRWHHQKSRTLTIPATAVVREPLPDAGHDRGIRSLLVLQLESFVDPHRLDLIENPLPGLQKLRERAFLQGPCEVPGYGAYTMRAETSVITGLPSCALGFEHFDPYLSLRAGRTTTMASTLQSAQWDTLFVHPYDLRFYDREMILPQLGFGTLIGADHFPEEHRRGPYISDRALMERVASLINEAPRQRGRLIFAVSMENHGPWKPQRLPGITKPFDLWLDHVRSSDRALQILIDTLDARSEPCLVAVYGDHTPLLPFFAGRADRYVTDYAVALLGGAGSEAREAAKHRPLRSDQLGQLLQGWARQITSEEPQS